MKIYQNNEVDNILHSNLDSIHIINDSINTYLSVFCYPIFREKKFDISSIDSVVFKKYNVFNNRSYTTINFILSNFQYIAELSESLNREIRKKDTSLVTEDIFMFIKNFNNNYNTTSLNCKICDYQDNKADFKFCKNFITTSNFRSCDLEKALIYVGEKEKVIDSIIYITDYSSIVYNAGTESNYITEIKFKITNIPFKYLNDTIYVKTLDFDSIEYEFHKYNFEEYPEFWQYPLKYNMITKELIFFESVGLKEDSVLEIKIW
jgi:hypothetical protein